MCYHHALREVWEFDIDKVYQHTVRKKFECCGVEKAKGKS